VGLHIYYIFHKGLTVFLTEISTHNVFILRQSSFQTLTFCHISWAFCWSNQADWISISRF